MKARNQLSTIRRLLTIFCVAFLMGLGTPFLPAQSRPQDPAKFETAFKQAQTTYANGDLEGTVISRKMLAEVQRKLSADPGKQFREKLGQITIKEVSFSDAELPVALEFLKKAAAEASGGQVHPNFIVHGFGGDAPKITLDLDGTVSGTHRLRAACHRNSTSRSLKIEASNSFMSRGVGLSLRP